MTASPRTESLPLSAACFATQPLAWEGAGAEHPVAPFASYCCVAGGGLQAHLQADRTYAGLLLCSLRKAAFYPYFPGWREQTLCIPLL